MMTVFFRQSSLSESSFLTSDLKNSSMVLEVLLHWRRLRYTEPVLSIPMMMDILGDTWSWASELLYPFGHHFWRLKSVMPNHDSSTLMILLPAFSRLTSSMAKR